MLGVLGYAVWVLAQVLLWGVQVTVPAHFCKIGGRVLGMVLLWDGVWGAL